MNLHLIIHNIGAIVSAVIAVGVAFFLFINGRKQTANITFAMVFLCTGIFYVSHVVGVNIADPDLSRSVLMGNMVILFIGAFNYHAVLATIKKDREHHMSITFVYTAAFVLSIFFFLFPDLFLLPSVPKMYFTNYYEPGIFNIIRVFYLYILIVPICVLTLYAEYKKSKSGAQRKQLKYFILTMIVGYGAALIPNFLIYNIPIDPLWGISFVVLCAVPLTYGAVKYELFNVQVIAKQAFVYSIAVAAVGGLITMLNYSSIWITNIYPNFPTWTLALVSALLAVSASIIVWKGLRSSDLLKAEFITTVTHKFRTPLTYIKWATDNLENPSLSPEDTKAQLEYIRTANEKLVELTNILTTASDAESVGSYNYDLKPANFSKIAEDTISSIEKQFGIKQIVVDRTIEPDLMARFDETRMKFVLQVLLENALHYSQEKGTVSVEVKGTRGEIICSVKDDGLGMTQEQISLLFSKFYRSDDARKLDTEGMGMGLFISARIVEKHNGKIWAESAGQHKGSIFYISLPRAK